MAALSYRSVATNSATSGSPGSIPSITTSRPTGAVEDDLLFAVFSTVRASAHTHTAPSGWTLITSETRTIVAGYTSRTSLYYKIATGSEPANYTFSTSINVFGASLKILAFDNPDTSAPYHTVTTVNGASGTSIVLPSITTTEADQMLVGVAYSDGGGAGTTFISGAMTERIDSDSIGIYTLLQVAAGASGTKTITAGASGAYRGFLVSFFSEPGVTEVDEDHDESIAAGDSLSDSIVAGQAVAESTGAGESFTDNVQVGEAIAESVAAGDALAESLVVPQAFSESVGAVDSLAESIVVPVSFSESVGAGDALAESIQAGESLTESLAAGDDYVDAVIVAESVAESTGADDDYVDEVEGGPTIVEEEWNESVTPSDDWLQNVIVGNPLEESLTPSDAAAEAAVAVEAEAESIEAGDSLSDAIVASEGLSEVLAATDDYADRHTAVEAFAEDLTAGDDYLDQVEGTPTIVEEAMGESLTAADAYADEVVPATPATVPGSGGSLFDGPRRRRKIEPVPEEVAAEPVMRLDPGFRQRIIEQTTPPRPAPQIAPAVAKAAPTLRIKRTAADAAMAAAQRDAQIAAHLRAIFEQQLNMDDEIAAVQAVVLLEELEYA